MKLTWEEARLVLQQADMIVVEDLVLGHVVVYAHVNAEDGSKIFLDTGYEVYCFLRDTDNESVEAVGSSLWFTAHDGGDPIQVTIYKAWRLDEGDLHS